MVSETTLKPAAHLTTVAANKTEVDGVLRDYWRAGVRRVVIASEDAFQREGAAITRACVRRVSRCKSACSATKRAN